MKKIIMILSTILVICILGLNSITAQNCGDLKTLEISTGINSSGVNLATTGLIDPFWQLTNVAPPSINGAGGINIPNAYTIPSGGTWVDIPGTVAVNVINTSSFNDNNTNPAQPWRFRRKFSVSSAASIIVSGSYTADDASVLNICDPSGVVLFTDNQAGWNVVKTFSTTLQVKQGCYYVEIELKNIGQGAMGFAVDANVTSPSNVLGNPSQACCTGSIISGQKWIDNNCDGVINSGDTPGVGWTFNLLSGSTIIQTTATNAFGEFYFNNVLPGTYTISEVNQIGFTPKNPVSGNQAVTVLASTPVSIVYFLNCKNQLPPCTCGQWGSTGYSINGIKNKFSCNAAPVQLQANQGDLFKLTPQYFCTGWAATPPCNTTIKYDIYYPKGGTSLNVNTITDLKLDSCGIIRIVMKPTCGGVACPPCEFTINVNCCKCKQEFNPMLIWASGNPNGNANFLDLKCGETYTDKLECFKQYYFYVDNPCGDNCSPDTVVTTIVYPSGATTVAYDLFSGVLIANQTGTYTVTIKVKCNGKWCAPCVIKFVQTKKCDPPCDNCKDKVKTEFDAGTSTVNVKNYPAASTLNALILLNGGADTYTQVRVNIVDFQISSDNPACLQCYNTPNQWGSLINGSLLSFTPAITNYASVSAFSPLNNPREIVFSAATPIAIPTDSPLNLTINLPGINTLSCCCIYIVLYVKITYRNNKCEECTKIERISLKICPKTNGDTGTPTNGGGTVTFEPTGGQPQYRMHAPSKEDAKILNVNPNTKNIK
jgi:hypothetical protein